MPTEVRLVVDRFEGSRAVLVGDDGAVVEVEGEVLPEGVGEGDVVRVPMAADGWRWASAVVDESETKARRQQAEGVLEELRGRDPGGDLAL